MNDYKNYLNLTNVVVRMLLTVVTVNLTEVVLHCSPFRGKSWDSAETSPMQSMVGVAGSEGVVYKKTDNIKFKKMVFSNCKFQVPESKLPSSRQSPGIWSNPYFLESQSVFVHLART